jgi:prepilin-type processing-associated H-X9-DG protein
MHNTTKKEQAGFTRTELLVLLGVVAVFSVALAADLTQTRAKLLQQACAANMKQWGLAFDLYSQDYNGTFYYDAGGLHFDDTRTPLEFYFGTIDSGHTNLRDMRLCPARRGEFDLNGSISPPHSYQMPIGIIHAGLGYRSAASNGSPYYRNGNYWPDLNSCPNLSKYLLLIECNGNTLNCGGLVSAVSTPHVGGLGGDPVPAINRHDGAVNCLFGDFHVELISSQTISNQDAIGCNSGNLWFMLN